MSPERSLSAGRIRGALRHLTAERIGITAVLVPRMQGRHHLTSALGLFPTGLAWHADRLEFTSSGRLALLYSNPRPLAASHLVDCLGWLLVFLFSSFLFVADSSSPFPRRGLSRPSCPPVRSPRAICPLYVRWPHANLPQVKQFIRNVRAAKTIADERAVIQKESAAIRASFREESHNSGVRSVPTRPWMSRATSDLAQEKQCR
jgi:hypothetical protein